MNNIGKIDVFYIQNKYHIGFDYAQNVINKLENIGYIKKTDTIYYLAVPKNEFIKKRLKDSKHERIYLYNILVGIIVLFASILSWIFFDNVSLLVILFIAGTSNIAISIYYTFTLIKLI